uniref:ankyrin repeat domain-containing protein 49-like n=1 Tax=Styela clava TaxID=7725 RepID=UPI001939C6F3|nr:ankyrin repeat domain-containing protein 49-like [Styela clava]
MISSSEEEDDVEPNDIREKLLWAAEKGNLELLQDIILQEPTVISHRDGDGYTALHRASYEGRTEVVKFLLKQGADLHAKTSDGWTPLHSACRWNEVGVCGILLHNGADVNSQSHGLQTPLHLAASCKNSKSILMLLLSQKDVKPDLKNSIGETAFEIARRTDKYSNLFDAVATCVTEYC